MSHILHKHIKVSVKIVFCHKNKVLYYKTRKGIRDVPGGHVNFGECVLNALERELKEEINFSLTKKPKLVYVWDYFSKDKITHTIYIGYATKLPAMIRFRSKEYGDSIKFVWLDKEEIKKQKFLPHMEKFLIKSINIFSNENSSNDLHKK